MQRHKLVLLSKPILHLGQTVDCDTHWESLPFLGQFKTIDVQGVHTRIPSFLDPRYISQGH